MANLIEVVKVAEALETKNVFVVDSRCVVVRNRNVKCRKCEKACPVGAFTIEGNSLELNNSVCVACGACTTVCPTEALIPLRPFDDDLAQSVVDACIHSEGTAVFACARIASKRFADSDDFAELACLSRVEESILVELAAQGIERILLVDGTCSTCKYRHNVPGINATIDSVNTLIEAMGSPIRVERRSGFPDDMLIGDQVDRYGVSRRGFFSQARGTAKDAAEKTVSTVLKSNEVEKVPTVRERLGMGDSGTLPQFGADRRIHILDAMDRLGEPQVEKIETRLWGNPRIDVAMCNSCNMCAIFCPTGALKKLDEEALADLNENLEEGAEPVGAALEFSAADCVQCRTCQDICLKKCLTIESVVSLEELFDFEPRLIPLPEPPPKAKLFGKNTSNKKSPNTTKGH